MQVYKKISLSVLLVSCLFSCNEKKAKQKSNALQVRYSSGIVDVVRYPHAHLYKKNQTIAINTESGEKTALVLRPVLVETVLVDDERTEQQNFVAKK